MLTKGTQLYLRYQNSNGYALTTIACPTGITGLGGGRQQIDVTCLDDDEMQYEPGMPAPTTVTVNLNFDPQKPSHLLLWNLFESGDTEHWIVGLSDGTAAPTVSSSTGVITYPTTRSYIDFDGYISDFPFDAAINTVYKSAMQIQRSGPRFLHVKST